MPFCPTCRSEYRDGFRTCADCAVPLVDATPEPKVPAFVPLYRKLGWALLIAGGLAGGFWAVERAGNTERQRRREAAIRSRQDAHDRWVLDVGILLGDTVPTTLIKCGKPQGWMALSSDASGVNYEVPLPHSRPDADYLRPQPGPETWYWTYPSGWTVTLADRKVVDIEPPTGWHQRHPDGLGWDPMRRNHTGKTPDQALLEEFGPDAPGYSASQIREHLNQGANPNVRSSEGLTILHAAASRGDAESLVLALRKGGKVEAVDDYGNTPLHYAARAEAARVLLDAGAAVNPANRNGFTPLDMAVTSGAAHEVQDLLRSRGGRTTEASKIHHLR